MSKRLTLTLGFLVSLLSLSPQKIYANYQEVVASAKLVPLKTSGNDLGKERRINILKKFLVKQDSPLSPYAYLIVEEAYKNDLDWRLIAAISGVESTFGKTNPTNSYNAYGWANGNYYFKSWEEGITIVSETLNQKYAKKWGAKTPHEIGRFYASSPTWAQRVISLMDQIEADTSCHIAALPLNL